MVKNGCIGDVMMASNRNSLQVNVFFEFIEFITNDNGMFDHYRNSLFDDIFGVAIIANPIPLQCSIVFSYEDYPHVLTT